MVADDRLRLVKRFAACFTDHRGPSRFEHPVEEMAPFLFSDEVRRRACGASHERNRLAPLHPAQKGTHNEAYYFNLDHRRRPRDAGWPDRVGRLGA